LGGTIAGCTWITAPFRLRPPAEHERMPVGDTESPEAGRGARPVRPYMYKESSMRSALVALVCSLGLVVSGGTSTRADDKADVEKELRKFHGVWTFESVEAGGKKAPAEELKGATIIFAGDKFTVKKGNEVIQGGTQKLDPSKSPKTIDVTMTEGLQKGAVMLGIYEIDGDTLTVCFDEEGKKRPTEFKSAAGSETFVNVHKRVKK
jgi:uncharacterized protein (TIGR03067 family)